MFSFILLGGGGVFLGVEVGENDAHGSTNGEDDDSADWHLSSVDR